MYTLDLLFKWNNLKEQSYLLLPSRMWCQKHIYQYKYKLRLQHLMNRLNQEDMLNTLGN